MKKFLFLAGLTILFVGIQFLMYCAKPLESDLGGPFPFPSDTIYVTDTVLQFDTTVVFDTVTIVDTVIITEPDTTGTRMLCARLGSHRHEIVWIFSNHEGLYSLDFSAIVDRDHPPKMLLVDVDGLTVEWFPIENMELTMELNLSEDFIIRITPQTPLSLGNTIDICLTLREL